MLTLFHIFILLTFFKHGICSVLANSNCPTRASMSCRTRVKTCCACSSFTRLVQLRFAAPFARKGWVRSSSKSARFEAGSWASARSCLSFAIAAVSRNSAISHTRRRASSSRTSSSSGRAATLAARKPAGRVAVAGVIHRLDGAIGDSRQA